MKGDKNVVEFLNELLSLELTVVNQYFVHSKMCENWGFTKLAARFRDASFDEMRDAEAIIDRVLYLGGLPNMQRLGSVRIGENVVEQLKLGAEAERAAVDLLRSGVGIAEKAGDIGTREFLAPRVAEEERHADWYDTQIALIDSIGEQNYLAQQIA